MSSSSFVKLLETLEPSAFSSNEFLFKSVGFFSCKALLAAASKLNEKRKKKRISF